MTSSQEPFLGQIKVFGFGFAPKGHAQCNGQLLQISTNAALFSLLGTTYGGNGVNNFALPDLRGRKAIHQGQGSGLPPFVMGQAGGEENHTLLISEMPAHNHLALSSANNADQTYPPNNLWANNASSANFLTSANNTMNPQTLANAGGGQAHNNMAPYLVVNFSIALTGIFPSRN